MKLGDVLASIGHSVSYYPALRPICGSVNAVIFLQQFSYWTGKQKNSDGWIFKTRDDIEAETGLTRTEQENARKQLRERGFIEEKLKGIPATLHYRINIPAINGAWCQHASWDESDPPVGGKPANWIAGNLPTIPETTTETTSESDETSSRAYLDSPKQHDSPGLEFDPTGELTALNDFIARRSSPSLPHSAAPPLWYDSTTQEGVLLWNDTARYMVYTGIGLRGRVDEDGSAARADVRIVNPAVVHRHTLGWLERTGKMLEESISLRWSGETPLTFTNSSADYDALATDFPMLIDTSLDESTFSILRVPNLSGLLAGPVKCAVNRAATTVSLTSTASPRVGRVASTNRETSKSSAPTVTDVNTSKPPLSLGYEEWKWVCDQLMWDPKVSTSIGIKKVKEMARDGITLEDMRSCAIWLMDDPYWSGKGVDIKLVQSQMAKFKNRKEVPFRTMQDEYNEMVNDPEFRRLFGEE
jgi:hypothetical protein